MENVANAIFGDIGEDEIFLVNELARTLQNFKYEFFSTDEISDLLLNEKVSEGMKYYWIELLNRLHFASSTSILRNQRWIRGILNSYVDQNYYTFAASFRGLLESVADSTDSLLQIPNNLADIAYMVRDIVHNKPVKQFVIAKELEEKLMHYSHARKLEKNNQFPKYFNAKSNQDYLQQFNDPQIKDCYSELCEITHPAARSVLFFLTNDPPDQDKHWVLVNDQDSLQIQVFCFKFKQIMPKILYLGINLPLINLKLLNFFELPNITTPIVNKLGMKQVQLWNDLKQKIPELD